MTSGDVLSAISRWLTPTLLRSGLVQLSTSCHKFPKGPQVLAEKMYEALLTSVKMRLSDENMEEVMELY